MQRHNKLIQEGYILDKVTRTYMANSNKANGDIRTFRFDEADYIDTLDYVQPANKNKTHYSDWWNFGMVVSDIIDKSVSVVVGLSKKYIWIPFTFFDFDTEWINDIISSGYVETVENSTLHFKVAYIYDTEDKKHYWGAEASCLNVNITSVSHWRDANKNPKSKIGEADFEYSSPNYYRSPILLDLGRKHYKDFTPYEETYTEPTSETIN